MTVRILCVEDNPQNMRLVRKILKSQGYEVIEAEDGFSGLNMAETQNPDLILMDVNLPDIDGLEVTRRIKAQDHLKPIPIVALTANAMFGDEERCLEAGCDGYIAKPVSKHKLLSNLKNYLSLIRDGEVEFDIDTNSSNDLQAILRNTETSTIPVVSASSSVPDIEKAEALAELEKLNFQSPKRENGSTAAEAVSTGQEHHPNISAFRKADQRHRFRSSATKPKPNSENEGKAASDNQANQNNA
jgi:two-component system cell cycle response regulator DivK